MIHDHSAFTASRAYAPDVAARVRDFMPMVRRQAWHLGGSDHADIEDLMQAGLVALVECAQRHDRQGDDGFAAYAKLRVRGAMIDLLRAGSPNVRGAGVRRRQLETAQSTLRMSLGREPSATETATLLGISMGDYQRLRQECRGVNLASLDEVYDDGDPAFATAEPDPESRLLQLADHAALATAIAALPDRLKLVIQLYFVEELNLSEIAAILQVSVPRVHQLKDAALTKLRLRIDTGPD